MTYFVPQSWDEQRALQKELINSGANLYHVKELLGGLGPAEPEALRKTHYNRSQKNSCKVSSQGEGRRSMIFAGRQYFRLNIKKYK